MKQWLKDIRGAALIWISGIILILAKDFFPFFYELGVGFFIAWLLKNRRFSASLAASVLLFVVLVGALAVDVYFSIDSVETSREFQSMLMERLSAQATGSLGVLLASVIVASLLLRRFCYIKQ